MKNISTVISAVALFLVAILFYLFLQRSKEQPKVTTMQERQAESSFKIAYFDIDSLEANYNYFKDALAQVKNRENAMNVELASIEKSYQKKISEWQRKGNSMSQAESDQAQREYATMQQTYQSRKQALQEELFKHQEDLKADIKKKIESFLKNYNKARNYSFIFAYESNSFMYYQDTAYNITKDLIEGLNASYKK
ncbi:MAG: OmpH family outer membrane protein [Chitinophagales bacterium]